ncbi:hypothetical protein H072_8617 [Dactylellina haptotyla CBS 200.50]|uniref:Ca3427-like PBP 2 domain-containing protein n=1 Tax=Dactylellina haptotyla (strain CBS 200.50) TaxID=1284197 RepID=S8BES0_DACHA|nr:hypothetical protein H072_8617 [Dactylellina haptotyla CBS 200.50]
MASTPSEPLRVGYVPEHFSTPLHLAQLHKYYASTTVTFHPFPSGTGHMIQSLKSHEIDVAVGLTEGWVAGIKGSAKASWYKVIGQYVASPLCWAISAGANRDTTVESLEGNGKVGISRIGSGSYIMSFVLAKQNGWIFRSAEGKKEPFEFVVLDNFKRLRDAVNSGDADAFMWEHFTSKKFYDSGEIKRIGEIYTPWPSWLITADTGLVESKDPRLIDFLDGLNKGIAHFKANHDEGITWITSNLEYSEEDAKEWRKGVRFVDDVKQVDLAMVENVIDILKDAGVVDRSENTDGVVVTID